MNRLRELVARVMGLFASDRASSDAREEFETHLDMETAEGVRRGLPPDEARRQAVLASGGITQAAEAMRDQRGLALVESLGADVRFALRSLRRSAGFTAVVIVTLALGIGANSAIFSVVRGVLLKPLPNRDGDRLVYLQQSNARNANTHFSVPEIRDLRTGVPAFSGIAEFSTWGAIHRAPGGSERITVGLITGNFFDVMGLAPVLGRVTQPGDDGAAAAPVAVLAHQWWIDRFAGDSTIVGKQITLNGRPVTVIGILEPAPFFPDRVDALLNMVNSEHHLGAMMQQNRQHRMTEAVARMTRGVSIEQARTQVGSVYARLQHEYPNAYPAATHFGIDVMSLKTVLGARARLTLWLLMASAAFVLIVSASNVANLTLMRGVRRDHELVVRVALGAGRARLRRLLLVENLILTLAGAVIGVFIARGGVALLQAFAARYSPRAADVRLDGVVLVFTLVVSLGIAVLLSLASSLPGDGRDTSRILSGAQRVHGQRSRHRLQRGLVVLQVAVTVLLLAGAGLLTRTLILVASASSGLASDESVLTMLVIQPDAAGSQDSGAVIAARQRVEQMRSEIAALPGVTAVGVGGTLPLRSSNMIGTIDIEGKARASEATAARGELRSADAEFFHAAGIPILEGRGFDAESEQRSEVVVNKALADRLFPNEPAIGKRIAWTMSANVGTWVTITGIVGTTRDGGPEAEPEPVIYTPVSQVPASSAAIVIRADHAAELVPAAMRIVRRIAPPAVIEEVMTVAQFKEQTVSPRRLNAELISLFGVLAVVIAAVGIAGMLAFSVGARTSEIGIRMSLGADRGRVQRMILFEGGRLVGLGLCLGMVAAFLSAGVIRGLLFGVAPHDPATFVGVAATMSAIGMIACWLPAARAARIDPAITMRA